jgi:FKBP-type peptidyl-prolyl cis-trans isomerase FkpA
MDMRRRDVFVSAGSVAALALVATTASCTRHARSVPPSALAVKVVTTRSGLSYEVVQQGTGAVAKAGQTVFIDETLTVDRKQIFSSRNKNSPVKFVLGGNQVIPGVDEAVTGMRVAERRKATVPPALDGRTFDPSFIRPDADRTTTSSWWRSSTRLLSTPEFLTNSNCWAPAPRNALGGRLP